MINLDERLLPSVDPDELYLLCWLTNRINKGRTCFPSNRLLKEDTGWGKHKLQEVKKRLKEKGLIETKLRKSDAGDWASTLYTIKTGYLSKFLGGIPLQGPTYTPTGVLGSTAGGHTVGAESGQQSIRNTEVLEKEVLETKVLESDPESEQDSGTLSFDSLRNKFDAIIWAFIDSNDMCELELHSFDTSFKDENLRGALEKFPLSAIQELLYQYINSKWDSEEADWSQVDIDYFLSRIEFYADRIYENERQETEKFIAELIEIYNTRRQMHDNTLRETSLPVDKKTFKLAADAVRAFAQFGGKRAIKNAFISFIDDEIKDKRYGTKKPLNYFFHKNKDTESWELIREHLNDYNTNYTVSKGGK